jgi:hypothetical protein
MLTDIVYIVDPKFTPVTFYLYYGDVSRFDTILTPFSLSPTTDTAVDSLPELFLAYCILADSDDVMSDDDQVVPRGSDSDSVPLLTDCALGLSPSFLSRIRR